MDIVPILLLQNIKSMNLDELQCFKIVVVFNIVETNVKKSHIIER